MRSRFPVSFPNPPAGQGVNFPRRKRAYRVISVGCLMQTVVGSVDNKPTLQVLNGDNVTIAAYQFAPIPAGTGVQVAFVSGLGYAGPVTGDTVVTGISTETWITFEMKLALSFTDADSFDQASGVVMMIEEDDQQPFRFQQPEEK